MESFKNITSTISTSKVVQNKFTALGLFSLIFIFNYGYALFLLNIPGSNTDTMEYMYAAKEILTGNIPIYHLSVDIPMGYPIFISMLFNLGGISTIVYTQVILFFTVCLLLISQVSKIDKGLGLLFSLLLTFWACDPLIMNQNIGLYPDGLYGISLVFMTVLLLNLSRNYNHKNLILFFTSIMFVVFIRSNGLYILFVPFLLWIIAIMNKKRSTIKHISLYTIASLLILSSANFILKGYFFPTDYYRIQKVASRFLKEDSNNLHTIKSNISVDKDTTTQANRLDLFTNYTFSQTHERPSFYYSLMPVSYVKYKTSIKYLTTKDSSYLCYFFSVNNAPLNISAVYTFMTSNHKPINYKNRNIDTYTNYQHTPRNPIIFASHLFYKLNYLIFLKFGAIILLFMLLFCYGIFRIIKQKNDLYYSWIVTISIGLIHILSIFVLTFAHNRLQIRYIDVTEYVIYLFICLNLYLIITKKPLFTEPKFLKK